MYFGTIVHLINMLPSTPQSFVNPYSTIFNKDPNFHFLKTFCCSYFLLVIPYNSYKLDSKLKKCIFIAYSQLYKGYNCLSFIGRIYISKGVLFN